MSGSQKAKKKVLRVLIRTMEKIRTLDRDFPITQIAWMSLNGELGSIGDPSFHRDLMALSKRTNDYKRRFWKTEEAIKQEFLHRMSKLRFSPSFSPEMDTLRTNLPFAILKEDGRLWIYSYDYYIQEIAKKVGRNPSEAPSGVEEYRYYVSRFKKEKDALHADALMVLSALDAFIVSLKAFISEDRSWNGLGRITPASEALIASKKPVILFRKPFPLPKVKRPRKSIFKRLKRETIGPEGGR